MWYNTICIQTVVLIFRKAFLEHAVTSGLAQVPLRKQCRWAAPIEYWCQKSKINIAYNTAFLQVLPVVFAPQDTLATVPLIVMGHWTCQMRSLPALHDVAERNYSRNWQYIISCLDCDHSYRLCMIIFRPFFWQIGATPLQCPPFWHSRVSFPLSMNPGSQV